MKQNEAPERIYFSTQVNRSFDGLIRKWADDDIEYVRCDAFLEKARSWLNSHYRDYMHNPTGKLLEAFFGGDMCNDFVDYMKGE